MGGFPDLSELAGWGKITNAQWRRGDLTTTPTFTGGFFAAYYKVLKIISEETRLVGWEFLV
jgi:hypothetical protein